MVSCKMFIPASVGGGSNVLLVELYGAIVSAGCSHAYVSIVKHREVTVYLYNTYYTPFCRCWPHTVKPVLSGHPLIRSPLSPSPNESLLVYLKRPPPYMVVVLELFYCITHACTCTLLGLCQKRQRGHYLN